MLLNKYKAGKKCDYDLPSRKVSPFLAGIVLRGFDTIVSSYSIKYFSIYLFIYYLPFIYFFRSINIC